ncbi:hypothetical protein [Elizabethkingia meningoseptica]|uniref:hypothetical protein n=1 Tax=Elizabethkingia meningoseptica TaxID=238 RepID=UPI00301A8418
MKNTLFISALLMIFVAISLALGLPKRVRMNMVVGGIIPIMVMLNVLYSLIKVLRAK